MDTSPGVFPSRLAISDVELGVSPPISAMAVRYRLPGVEALCHLDEYSPSSSSALAYGSLSATALSGVGFESDAFQAAFP